MQFIDTDWLVIPEEGITNSGPGLKLHFCDPVWMREDEDQELVVDFTWTMDPDQGVWFCASVDEAQLNLYRIELEAFSTAAGTAITRRKNSPLRPDRLEVCESER